jgi:hypothetical protein
MVTAARGAEVRSIIMFVLATVCIAWLLFFTWMQNRDIERLKSQIKDVRTLIGLVEQRLQSLEHPSATSPLEAVVSMMPYNAVFTAPAAMRPYRSFREDMGLSALDNKAKERP